MTITEHRKHIDQLDARIVELLNERTTHALGIGAIKLRKGESFYAPHRELAVFKRIGSRNKGPLTQETLKAVYREIMSGALALQKTLKIAYFGPPATFTHQAAIRRFGSSLTYAAQKTITDVFAEVSKHRADYGVVPVENSTEGVVTHTLDMFVDSDLKVVAQIILPIEHCLLSRSSRAQIKKLYSHPQPIAQCRTWVQNYLPKVEIIETSSTPRAAELASRAKYAAAIASALAAERYSVPILDRGIQDNAANATRFLVLGSHCSPPTGNDRTSIMISLTDKVGALHKALEPFRKNRINMTKIESRPSKRKAWEYFFFIDCDGHQEDAPVAKAIKLLEQSCSFVKVLGSYPNTD